MHFLRSIIVLALSFFLPFFGHFLSLQKIFVSFGLTIPIWKRLVVINYLSLLRFLVNYLLIHFFCLFLHQHIVLNVPHQLISFLLVNMRLVLVMDHLAVLPHPHCFQLTSLQESLLSFLCLFSHLVHSLMRWPFVVRLCSILWSSWFHDQFELLLSFDSICLQIAYVAFLMASDLVETHRFSVLPYLVQFLFSHSLLRFHYPFDKLLLFLLEKRIFGMKFWQKIMNLLLLVL